MSFYFVYMLRCVDNSLYCGQTQNIDSRLKEHRSGTDRASKYVRSKLPVILVYQEQCASRSAALKREREIKSWTKQKKERLVTEYKMNYNTPI